MRYISLSTIPHHYSTFNAATRRLTLGCAALERAQPQNPSCQQLLGGVFCCGVPFRSAAQEFRMHLHRNQEVSRGSYGPGSLIEAGESPRVCASLCPFTTGNLKGVCLSGRFDLSTIPSDPCEVFHFLFAFWTCSRACPSEMRNPIREFGCSCPELALSTAAPFANHGPFRSGVRNSPPPPHGITRGILITLS